MTKLDIFINLLIEPALENSKQHLHTIEFVDPVTDVQNKNILILFFLKLL